LIAETASGKRSAPSVPVEAHTAQKKSQSPPTNIRFRPLHDSGSVLVEWTPAEEGEDGDISVNTLLHYLLFFKGYKIAYTDTSENAPDDEWKQVLIGHIFTSLFCRKKSAIEILLLL
jgi:hypothetical protein